MENSKENKPDITEFAQGVMANVNSDTDELHSVIQQLVSELNKSRNRNVSKQLKINRNLDEIEELKDLIVKAWLLLDSWNLQSGDKETTDLVSILRNAAAGHREGW